MQLHKLRQKIRKQLKSTVSITMILAILMFASTIIATPILYKPVYAQGNELKNLDNTDNLGNNVDDNSDNTLLSNSQKAVSGRNVYVVWSDDTPGNNEIFFKRSTDGGQTFENIQNLSNNAGSSGGPQIAASGKNVYVVWSDDTPGNVVILFKKSTDGGQTFEDALNLSDNAGLSQGPQIAIS